MSLRVYSSEEYKVLEKSSPEADITVCEYNLITEPVYKIAELDSFIVRLKRQKIPYLLAQVDTVIKSKFGERYKRAYGLFTEAGELMRNKK
jgi:hypothetical protein